MKIKCAIPGCKYEATCLTKHIRTIHGLNIETYRNLYPEASLYTKEGKEEYEAECSISTTETRKQKLFSVVKTFGISLGMDGTEPRDKLILGYEEPTEWTPAIDSGYVFQAEDTMMLLMGLASRDRILITGPSGTGKTSIVEQIAARLNYSVVKISFDGGITRSDLIGEWIVHGKEMTFQYGILPMAMRMPGTIILLDEWDTINEETSFVIQRPLQREDGKLLILEHGGELIHLHDENIICATANTIGQGDDSGLYSAGTRVQNFSQINRFSLALKFSYLPPELEKNMLKLKYPDLQELEIDTFVKCANAIRDGHNNSEVSVPLTPRDLLNWCEKYSKIGDPIKSAKYCFLNRMSIEDATVVQGILERHFS